MKSQVLMSLHEMFPAVHAAEMAVQRNPHSWESWQTLGRAQLGLGEIVLCLVFEDAFSWVEGALAAEMQVVTISYENLRHNLMPKATSAEFLQNLQPELFGVPSSAIRSFQVALHIYPMNPEIWKEDLSWARTLQEQQKVAQRIKKSETPSEETHFSPKSIPDYDFESDEIVAVCAAIAEKQKTVSANKTMVIVSASGTVETVTEKEEGATAPDSSVFIKAR
ncbi:Tetratricopeptide repeat protein 33 [Heterocephalus glaber]|uniref:Tetratricopeptide repeat protein 33 n=1 Tax=Heterocephalus glaber TaxID=10181 RepID=G5B8F8_HETGA|nr:Tetratricopeptide repeat protein 33 [Heterocephalus glaber]